MALSDNAPSDVPVWVIGVEAFSLSLGVVFWIFANVFMVHRAFDSSATPVPLLALGLCIGWTVSYGVVIANSMLEYGQLALWAVSLAFVAYAVVSNAARTYGPASSAARLAPFVLTGLALVATAGHVKFAEWWLAEPDRGYGSKEGKSWHGEQHRDSTELMWWTAGSVQLFYSIGGIAMLLTRRHSGGQGIAIWACRLVGSTLGLYVPNVLIWYYWPQPHGYIFQPLSILLYGTSIACDLYFPFLLQATQATEKVLPDGRVVSADSNVDSERKTK